jgi:hypothetical protein
LDPTPISGTPTRAGRASSSWAASPAWRSIAWVSHPKAPSDARRC